MIYLGFLGLIVWDKKIGEKLILLCWNLIDKPVLLVLMLSFPGFY